MANGTPTIPGFPAFPGLPTTPKRKKDDDREFINDRPKGTPGAPPRRGLPFGSEADLVSQAERVEREEGRRREEGLDVLRDAFAQSQGVFERGIDKDLLFSRAADSIGARARRGLESLRTSLAGRGLRPGSGAAQGALGRLAAAQSGQLIGAQRDINIEDARQRQINAATNFVNALGLNQAITAPVSGARLDTLLNLFEGQIAKEGIAAAAAGQRAASRDSKTGSLGGGILGLAGSAIGK